MTWTSGSTKPSLSIALHRGRRRATPPKNPKNGALQTGVNRCQKANGTVAEFGNRQSLPRVDPAAPNFHSCTDHLPSLREGIKSRPSSRYFDLLFLFFLHVDNTSVSHPLLLGPPSNHQQLLTTLLSHQQENHFYSICPLLCSLKEPQIPPGLMIHILVSQQ